MPSRAQSQAVVCIRNVVSSPSFFADDERLRFALRERHMGARAALYARFAPEVELLLLRVLGPSADVSALTRRVFVRACLQAGKRSSASGESLRTWILRIALRQAERALFWRRLQSRLRFGRFGTEPVASVTARPSVSGARPSGAHAYAIIHSLPARQASALALHWAGGYSCRELAELCGIAPECAAYRLGQAERRFSSRMERVRRASGSS